MFRFSRVPLLFFFKWVCFFSFFINFKHTHTHVMLWSHSHCPFLFPLSLTLVFWQQFPITSMSLKAKGCSSEHVWGLFTWTKASDQRLCYWGIWHSLPSNLPIALKERCGYVSIFLLLMVSYALRSVLNKVNIAYLEIFWFILPECTSCSITLYVILKLHIKWASTVNA